MDILKRCVLMKYDIFQRALLPCLLPCGHLYQMLSTAAVQESVHHCYDHMPRGEVTGLWATYV